MIRLVSTFLNSEGKKHNFSFKDPDTTKSPEEIKETLALLTSLELFEKDGVGLFKEIVKAKYVETIERPIFDGGEMFGVSAPEEPDGTADTTAEQATVLRCTWEETPKLPEVYFDLPPIRSEVHEVLSAHLNHEALADSSDTKMTVRNLQVAKSVKTSEEASLPADNFYDVVKELVKRRKRRKAKEQEKRKQKAPPETPS
ncbi:DUF2922 domain-containing protein [Candidatus Enterococcus ferrettii]|uniref:Uncharacterized protein n=1 Tax=Candidatus Enterococcus ferrettii TaxID=2815324 RepID=A0ABV0ETV3_9ENTE|nr:DUF2922 domain-containing protein [Enterococcus sp. 665A]MBO1339311.1 DUF2922 domain-containing protein [Enterococcus sp. 665A]